MEIILLTAQKFTKTKSKKNNLPSTNQDAETLPLLESEATEQAMKQSTNHEDGITGLSLPSSLQTNHQQEESVAQMEISAPKTKESRLQFLAGLAENNRPSVLENVATQAEPMLSARGKGVWKIYMHGILQ